MKKGKRITAVIVTLAIIVGAVAGGIAIAGRITRSGPVPVVPASALNYGGWYGGEGSEGYVTGDVVQNVYVTSAETIDEVVVEEGQPVKEGDILIRYDGEKTALALEKAQLGLDQIKLHIRVAEQNVDTLNRIHPVSYDDGGGDDYWDWPDEPEEEPYKPVLYRKLTAKSKAYNAKDEDAGTEYNPLRFLCADGCVVEASFIRGMKTKAEEEPVYFVLEVREDDDWEGMLLRSWTESAEELPDVDDDWTALLQLKDTDPDLKPDEPEDDPEPEDDEVRKLRKEIEELEQQIEEQKQKIRNLEEELEEERGRKEPGPEDDPDELRKQIEKLEEKIKTLEEELEEARRQPTPEPGEDTAELQRKIQELEEQIRVLEEELEEARQHSGDPTPTPGEDPAELKKQIEELNAQIADLNGQLQAAREASAADQSTIADLRSKIGELEAEIERLKEEIEHGGDDTPGTAGSPDRADTGDVTKLRAEAAGTAVPVRGVAVISGPVLTVDTSAFALAVPEGNMPKAVFMSEGDEYSSMPDPSSVGLIPSNAEYTAEELADARREAAETLRDYQLDLREAELKFRDAERAANEGVVRASMDGVVQRVGDPENPGASGPFITVSPSEGLFVKGGLSENRLDSVKIGDPVMIMSWETGESFEGKITEISPYPDKSGMFGWGDNSASYYPFIVNVSGDAQLADGSWVQLTLPTNTAAQPGEEDGSEELSLWKAFILEENGHRYVYKRGEDGKLVKTEIRTGKKSGEGYVIESGVDQSDFLAFPYAKNVKEGAETREASVDELYTM